MLRKTPMNLILSAVLVWGCGAAPKEIADPSSDASVSLAADMEIPFEKFVLDNGLTLIVHEDHKAPIVAVNVWYHVGSKNERVGRTGFAHLFEHLMFNGSENYNDDYFQPLERVGATDLNGTTNSDRTNYFQNVPAGALDLALFMESDRMGHLLGAVDQARLDEQRGVVQNEKRQGENQPYGLVWELMTQATYPKGHPYSWSVIGSMEDLDAASLEDVQEWFKTYYGAANATVVIAGDIDPQTAKAKVEEYFGDIPAGPPMARFESWVAPRKGSHRQVLHDRVPQSRIYKQWNVAQWGTPDAALLELLVAVLADGKSSRLYKRLVYDDQVATAVNAYYDDREIGGQLVVEATAKPGVDLPVVERALDEELMRLIEDGIKADELLRAKTDYISSFVRGIERIGGFGGKSDVLARNQVFAGDPAFYKVSLERVRSATTAELQHAAQKWLGDGVFNLEVHPFPSYQEAAKGVERSALPEMTGATGATFPALKRAELSNGLNLVVVERHSVPVVLFDLVFDAGYASDSLSRPGTAKLAMGMLDEGTQNRTALEISDELARLGARLYSGSNLDQSYVYLSALKENLTGSLDLFADVVLRPAFPQNDFNRLKKQQLARIEQELARPMTMALRLFPELIYGRDHAYGLPFTGSGYSETVNAIERDDLVAFQQTWLRPGNATMVVVGDTTLAEVQPMIEALFADWESTPAPQKNIAPVTPLEKSTLYIIDRPGAIQSVIMAGHTVPPKADPRDIAMDMMNQVLGGSFTSRINMNLREDKHWSYGARSMIIDSQGERPFLIFAAVQADKTKESVAEVLGEVRAITGRAPVTEEELGKVKNNKILELPGRWETMDALDGSISEIVRFGLPDDYYNHYATQIEEQTLIELSDAAREVLRPEGMIWVVVGDRKSIEPGLKELGFDDVKVIELE